MTEEPNASIETALSRSILTSHSLVATKRDAFYASSIGFCPRKQVAERAGLPPTHPPDLRSQFKMWTGMKLGQAIQEALELDGYLDKEWHEKRFTYKNYVGKIDGYTNTIPAIVEIKTSDDDAITRYQDLPEHYLWQGMWYCLASGIPTLLLFQVGKNQGVTRNRVLTLDGEWKTKLETHMEGMQHWWDDYERTHQLPEHWHAFSWEDRYCPYLDPDTPIPHALHKKGRGINAH